MRDFVKSNRCSTNKLTKVPIHEKIEWVPFVLSKVSITWQVEENGDSRRANKKKKEKKNNLIT